jgi:parallel beta-helix repeat protein
MGDKQLKNIKYITIGIITGSFLFLVFSLSIASMIVSPQKLTIYQTDIAAEKDNIPFNMTVPAIMKDTFPVPYLFSLPDNTQRTDEPSLLSDQQCSIKSNSMARNVNINIELLRYASKMNLNFFPDFHQMVSRVRIEYRSKDDFTWFGSINASNEINAILTVKGQALCGNVTIHQKTYHIEPIDPPLHRISIPDYSQFPEEYPPIKSSTQIQKDLNYTLSYEHGDDGSIVHVMVVYTEQAALETGNIHATIQLAIDETNLSFEKSQIQTKLNLIHTQQVNYIEKDILTDLKGLTSQNDGVMDDVHLLRDQYCADIVVLIRAKDCYCGVSYINADSEHAFCVVSQDCATGYYSFGHEIGHLFGARHNPEEDPFVFPYPYGHGYLHSGGWRTIMAYNDSQICPNGFCKRILNWSNPSRRYQDIYMGTFSTHNNARLLNETATMVSNFRYFGKGFTINNTDQDTLTVMSVVPEKEWIAIIHPPEESFEIAPGQSRTIKMKINWEEIQDVEDSYIWIATSDKEIGVQVTAIPDTSLPILSVTPEKITSNTLTSIETIHINNQTAGFNKMKWRTTSASPWITVLDGHRGVGNAIVTLRIDQNFMGKRTGIIYITAPDSQNIRKTICLEQSGNHLFVELPHKVKESDKILFKSGKVSVPQLLDKPLRIQFQTSDPSEIIVPEYVVIPERHSFIDFDINIQDDNEPDGPKIVTIRAEATGWQAGEAKINILDDDSQGVICVGHDQVYEKIQEAINDAAPESSILVKNGTYIENLVIDKPLHIYSENGPEQTIIQAKLSTNHVIDIQKSHTIIEGFSISGADSYGEAGIFLSETVSNCMIKHNICGIDDHHHNYHGIYVEGSSHNTFSDNVIQFNKRYGVYLYQANDNTFFQNHIQLNEKTGIYLYKSQQNIFSMNALEGHHDYGLYIKQESFDNQIYLNAFVKNSKGHVYSKSVVNRWHTVVPTSYRFGRKKYQGFLGNYYDDHNFSDHNENGITNEFYSLPGDEAQDEYSLSGHLDQYEFFTRYADGFQNLHLNHMSHVQAQCSCASGDVLQFKSNLETDLTWDMTAYDAWTGNIRLKHPLEPNHFLTIQIGIIDETDTFTAIGKSIAIKGKTLNLPFCIFPGPFSTPPGQWFGFQIANESPQNYTIIAGGGNTFISPYKHTHTNTKEWLVGQDEIFRTIQSALDFSHEGYTINVLPGLYSENIKIVQPVTLISEKGYTQTFISSTVQDKHGVNIASDSVHIKGFTIYGANKNNAAAICIDSGVAHCIIENNRCGYDITHTNDYGLLIQSSMENTIYNNQFISNEKHGIWIDNSFKNNFHHNWCFCNQDYGLLMTYSLYNQLNHNIFEANDLYGICIKRSFRNQLTFNIVDSNKKGGVYIDRESSNNTIYLNNFVLNRGDHIDAYGINRWYSSEPFIYKYLENIFTEYMGNYYSDNTLQDDNNDGINDLPYEISGTDRSDPHALIHPYSAYALIQENDLKSASVLAQHIAAEPKKISETTSKTDISVEPIQAEPEEQTIVYSNQDVLINEPMPKEHSNNQQIDAIQPILVFTDIPVFGNRIKNLKGLLINAPADKYNIAVYIKIEDIGWRSKPYIQQHIIPINEKGLWECDITTAPFDQNATEIIAFLIHLDDIPPALIDAPVLPDVLFEKSAAVVRVSR